MTGQADVRDAIVNASTDAGARVYALDAGNAPTAPYVIVTRIDGVPNIDLRGSGLVRFRYQVDVFATTLAEAQSIAAAVGPAMEGAAFKGIALSYSDGYEDAVQLYRVTRDFAVWQ